MADEPPYPGLSPTPLGASECRSAMQDVEALESRSVQGSPLRNNCEINDLQRIGPALNLL
jgi:hypothetical protein